MFRADSSPHWLEALAPRVPDLQPLYSLLRPLVTQDYRLGADTSRRAFLGHTLSFGCTSPSSCILPFSPSLTGEKT